MSARTVVLAAVDQTPATDEVTRTAIELSRVAPGGELHFIYVVNPSPRQLVGPPAADLVDAGSAFVDELVREASALTPVGVAGHLGIGEPVARILQVAVDVGADLLILGTHERRGISWLLGSVSRKIMRRAPCAVLLARPKGRNLVHRASGTPALEPPCSACVDVQFATRGAQLWCEQHAARHVHGHLHYGFAQGYVAGSMFLRADV